MTKARDLVQVFEQTAARRAQDALQVQVSACFAPLRQGSLTERDCQGIDAAGRAYMRPAVARIVLREVRSPTWP